MKKIAFIFIAIVFVTAGCSNELEKNDPYTDGVQGENFTFYSNKALFDQSLLQRSVGVNSEFSIVKVDAVKNYFFNGDDALVVTTSMNTKCEGDFKVIWDGSVMESYPSRINLLLLWSGTCDDLLSPTEEVLILNINELITDNDLSVNSLFSVINGSASHAAND